MIACHDNFYLEHEYCNTCDQVCAKWTLVVFRTDAMVTSNQIYTQSTVTAWRSYAINTAFIRCCKKQRLNRPYYYVTV